VTEFPEENSLLSTLFATLSSHPSFAVGGGASSDVIAGRVVVGVLGGLINMVVPLSIGGTGSTTGAAGASRPRSR
jgi:hypothetical protein